MYSNYFINPHLFNSAYAGIEDTQVEKRQIKKNPLFKDSWNLLVEN